MVEAKFYQSKNEEIKQQPESLERESRDGDLEKESNTVLKFAQAVMCLLKKLPPNMLFCFAATGIFVYVSTKDDSTNMYCNMNPFDN